MSLIVQKFGGSSLADAEKLLHAAHITKEARDAGGDVVVVVSAQGDTTDELLEKAHAVSPEPPLRELDALLATGEQISAALFAMALQSIGIPAVSLSAWQIPVRADGMCGDARITLVGSARIRQELDAGRVVVVTGFQGVSDAWNVMTLGRGGSDYSAVALAAALDAARCVIYTDVDGVCTADPRLCPTARRLDRVSYEDMYALASAGAQVLHDKCVRLAAEKGVEPEVRSCAPESVGTRVSGNGGSGGVAGVTLRDAPDEAFSAVTLVGAALPSLRLEKRAIAALETAGIAVHGVEAGERTLSLHVPRERSREALCAVHDAVLLAGETNG